MDPSGGMCFEERMLLSAVERALAAAGIERRGEAVVLVACSGGLDSVALAHGVVELLGARRVVLGHVDHGTREGSEEDARFVSGVAERLGLDLRLTRLQPKSRDEATLRDLRYDALEAQRQETGAELILTAHTADDQAETVLLNLIRSTRPRGLAGMPRRRGRVLRPLLEISRADVLEYAERRGFTWIEDPTNREPFYLRNRIRKELLPLLELRYRPGLKRRLARLAAEMSELLEEEEG